MIQLLKQEDVDQVVITPNKSASWQQNLVLLFSLALLLLVISIGFAILGAWVILPFAGLEILLLSAVFYYVSWQVNRRQVLSIEEHFVILEKGYFAPRKRWIFARGELRLARINADHEWDAPSLSLFDKNKKIPLAEFVNKDDACQLIDVLAGYAIRADTAGSSGKQLF